MNDKWMVVALAAVSAVVVLALPSTVSAGEFVATCSGGGTCAGTVQGTANAVLEDDSGGAAGRVTCTTTTGTVSQPNNSSTNTVNLTFHGCTSNGFSCIGSSPAGGTSGTIKTNTLTGHNVRLVHGAKEPVGILLTGINVTYTCAGGLVKKTLTGNVIGQTEGCSSAKSQHSVIFQSFGEVQQWRQITTTGTIFGLLVNNDAGGEYTETAFIHALDITWDTGKTVTLDC